MNVDVLFGAEVFCWPDQYLKVRRAFILFPIEVVIQRTAHVRKIFDIR